MQILRSKGCVDESVFEVGVELAVDEERRVVEGMLLRKPEVVAMRESRSGGETEDGAEGGSLAESREELLKFGYCDSGELEVRRGDGEFGVVHVKARNDAASILITGLVVLEVARENVGDLPTGTLADGDDRGAGSSPREGVGASALADAMDADLRGVHAQLLAYLLSLRRPEGLALDLRVAMVLSS